MTEAIGCTTTGSRIDSVITDSLHLQAGPEISQTKTQYKVPMIQIHEHSSKSEQPTVEDTHLISQII